MASARKGPSLWRRDSFSGWRSSVPRTFERLLTCAEWVGSKVSTEVEEIVPPWHALDVVQVPRRGWMKVHGPLPVTRKEWVVLTHPSGAVARIRRDFVDAPAEQTDG